MLIDFNQKQEITMPGMNNGTGIMTAKMYMNEQGKIIPFVMGKKKFCLPEVVISVKKARRTVLSIPVIRI